MSRLSKPNISIAPALAAPPEFWRAVWRRLEDEGTAGIVFYDGSVRTADEFAATMSLSSVHPFSVHCNGRLAGIAWLTNMKKRSAHAHFIAFREFGKYSRIAFTETVKFIMSTKYEDGSYCLDVLIGMTPENNMPAFNLAIKSGFKYVGKIPLGAYIEEEKKSIGILVSAGTREDI